MRFRLKAWAVLLVLACACGGRTDAGRPAAEVPEESVLGTPPGPASDLSVCPQPCPPDQQARARSGFAALIERFGTSERQVRATLGPPVFRNVEWRAPDHDRNPGDSTISLEYDGLIVRFYSSAQQPEPLLYEVEASSEAFGRTRGVGVGSLLPDVEARFGSPHDSSLILDGTGDTQWYYSGCPDSHIGYCAQGFYIQIRAGRVVRISWHGGGGP